MQKRLKSKVYKLDETQIDEGDKKRAKSSHVRRKRRSLASQLKFNDIMLQRGVTGSPVTKTASSPTQNFQLKELVARATAGSMTSGSIGEPAILAKTTTAKGQKGPTTTLIINYELDEQSRDLLKLEKGNSQGGTCLVKKLGNGSTEALQAKTGGTVLHAHRVLASEVNKIVSLS